VAIQGFGNVGSHAAGFLHQAGTKIVAVSDVDGAVFNRSGLDIPSLFDLAIDDRSRRVTQWDGEKDDLQRAGLLALDCEVLTPAALQGRLMKRPSSRCVLA
jgi:glutamate dehydrogenase/leucine dehydrogenase